jgi:2-dehydropantoate 2-reductase
MHDVAVVGPGSVGSFFAAQLTAAGRTVLSCARRPFSRYVVESPEAPVDVAADVLTDPAGVDAPVPWVLLTVKAHQTEGARPWLERLCDEATQVVVVQNGVEQEARGRAVSGPAEVVPGVVYCGAELLAPGHVKHHQHSTLFVPDTDAGHGLVTLFAGTPCRIRPTPTWSTEAWRKLGANVVANGITALTLRRISVLADPAVGELAVRVLRECWAVGRAEGADVDEQGAEAMARAMGASAGDGGTSMLYDRLAGRPLEHDALYGAVVRAGHRHGIPTPLHEALLALLAASAGPSSAN